VNAHAVIPEAAPLAYQAEILRGQVCDDLNRRFWRARKRLTDGIENRKDQVQRDSEKLSPEAFLAKYHNWRFL
jgi:hypothetical protein